MAELEEAAPRGAFLMGLALSVVNPNAAILLSGLSGIAASDVGFGASVLATVVLLVSSILDFVVPILAFVLLGSRAQLGLDRVKRWMLLHNRGLGIAVFLVFGLLFLVRGLRSV